MHDGRERGMAKRSLLAAGLVRDGGAGGLFAPRSTFAAIPQSREDMIHIRQGITAASDVRRGPRSAVDRIGLRRQDLVNYISKREETVAFFAPEVKTQQVIELQFDDEQVVKRIRTYGLKDARKVDRITRTTKAAAGEPGVFRSMLDLLVRRRAVTGKSRKSYGL